jgi:hypothetical protein
LESGENGVGKLQIALTDPPDSFLEIAHHALQLELGEIQVRDVAK